MPITSNMLEKAVTLFLEAGAAANLEERMPELRGHRNRLRAEAWAQFHLLPLSAQREYIVAANPKAARNLQAIDPVSERGVLRGFRVPGVPASGSSGSSGDDFKHQIRRGIHEAFFLMNAWYGPQVALAMDPHAKRIFELWGTYMEEFSGAHPAHVAIVMAHAAKMADAKVDVDVVDRILVGDDPDMIASISQLHWRMITRDPTFFSSPGL